jgi:hypothetical protein
VTDDVGAGAADLKQCPRCAELIQNEAWVCRYCGFDYAVGRTGSVAKTNGFAVASLVLGIVWVYWIGSVLAVIFGFIALNQIKKLNGVQSGKGMAIAGLVLGFIGIAMIIVVVILIAMADPYYY